jgi:ferredoxin
MALYEKDAVRERLSSARDRDGGTVRVVVDLDLCLGHAQCEDAAPEVFEVQDDGYAHVLVEHPGPDLQPQVEEAVRRCPTEAISIVED